MHASQRAGELRCVYWALVPGKLNRISPRKAKGLLTRFSGPLVLREAFSCGRIVEPHAGLLKRGDLSKRMR